MDNNLEIDRMLTLSTSHITQETAEYLDDKDRAELIVYNKNEFGWFICVSYDALEKELSIIPDDLARVIKFALKNNCTWLCLDGDGFVEPNNELPTYEW